MPKVSVIIPNYNYARYLHERMESVLNQTFTDYEIILLDDASDDNSRDILKELSLNPKVTKTLINDSNSGSPFRQWQRGIELAQGEYIWIAEADDSSAPTFLERCVNALDHNPKAVLAFTGSNAIGSEGEEKDIDYDQWFDERHKKRVGKELTHDGVRFVTHNQYWRCYVYNASGTVFRRSAFGNGKDFGECFSMRNSGDWLFWSIVAAKGEVIEIYDKLNIIRRHDANQTEKGIKNGNIFFDDLKVIKYIESHFPVGRYRRTVRHGTLYKNTMRSSLPEELKGRIVKAMHDTLGFTMTEYRLERLNKLLWNIWPDRILTQNNDRL